MSQTGYNTTPEETQVSVVSKRAQNRGRKAVEKFSQKLERLEVDYVGLHDISPNDYNPNRQDDHSFEMLINSMEENGFTQPILVNAENVIVDGEHRWRAAEALNMAEVPIVRVNMTPEQMRIATISHNKARGEHDIELEVQLFRDLEALGALEWATDSLDISDTEIQKLLADIPAPESMMDEEFSTAWEPTDDVREEMRASDNGRGTDNMDLSSQQTVSSHFKGGHVKSMTSETLDRVREREDKLKLAKSEQERVKIKEDLKIFRLSLVYHGDEAETVKAVLGDEPAVKVLELCKQIL